MRIPADCRLPTTDYCCLVPHSSELKPATNQSMGVSVDAQGSQYTPSALWWTKSRCERPFGALHVLFLWYKPGGELFTFTYKKHVTGKLRYDGWFSSFPGRETRNVPLVCNQCCAYDNIMYYSVALPHRAPPWTDVRLVIKTSSCIDVLAEF